MRTTSSWWLLSMAEVFRRQQLPVKQLFSDAGLNLMSLAHETTRFPQDGVTRLWDGAQVLSGNDHLGLDLGRQISVAGFPVLGYSLVTATGLVDGFQRFLRYQRMIGESANIRLDAGNQFISLDFYFVGDDIPVSMHSVDAAMAAMVRMARLLEGDEWHPDQVLLRRSPPRNPRLFASYYGCPVSFNQSCDQIQLLSQSLVSGINAPADPLWEEAIQSDKPTAELVAMLLTAKLQDGSITKNTVAESLNITPRTLQRRLAREGESYQEILDRVRHQKALEALANPALLPIEIAFLCGFSDLSAFHHAFKRWQGQTPGEYRQTILGG